MTRTKRIRPWRRLAEICQAVIIIGIPFLKIKGESALRFDVPSLRLHFFGSTIWMEESFIVLVALMFVSLLIAFVTLMLGRIWCGWVCPQTVIVDFTAFADKTVNKGLMYKLFAYLTTAMISIIVAANLIWYFVSPYEFIPDLIEGGLGKITWGFWTVLSVVMALNFILLRQKFCATVCPYAKLQSTLYDDATMVIAFDPGRKDECVECMACVRTCPVGIDIREGLNAACINCAECIDACAQMMDKRQKRPLIGYFFGMPGENRKLLRQNAVLIGTVTTAFLVFFLYLLFTRNPLDMIALPNYSFQPRVSADGALINSYILSVKNRGRNDEALEVTAALNEGTVRVTPDKPVHVGAGEIKKFPVYISVRDIDKNKEFVNIVFILESSEDEKLKVTRKARFIIPGR